MKIKNRKHHKKCYSEKTLREVSKGKITKAVIVEVPKRFYKVLPNGWKLEITDFQKEFNIQFLKVTYHNGILKAEIINKNVCQNLLKLGTGIIKTVGKTELALKDFLEGIAIFKTGKFI